MSRVDEGNWKSQDFVEQLNGAIRENPVAAALIGAGAVWMLLGGSKGLALAARGVTAAGGAVASTASSAASSATQAVSSAMSSAKSGLADAGQKAKDSAASVRDSAPSVVPDMSVPDRGAMYDAVTEAGSAMRDRVGSAVASGREYGSVLQGKLADSLERQPLLLGALGLAIGAGIASTFAVTELEERFVGEKATAARQEFKARAEQAMATVRDELQSGGVTREGAKDVAADLAAKAKKVAAAGTDSVAQAFSQPKTNQSF